MPRFLLRAEAVNFAWSCYDTQDLSTIRGGSMLMMNAHKMIPLPSGLQLEAHGASQSVWSFEATDEAAAEGVRRAVEKALTGHGLLKHATFVVDVVPESGDDAADLYRLRARNRWRQLQQPTLAVPEQHSGVRTSAKSYCQFDGVRPGRVGVMKGGDRFRVSPSVKARRGYGRRQKKAFYPETVPGIADLGLSFTNELEEVTSRAGCGPDDPLEHLDHRMAVIYCDGNKQGEMAARLNREKLAEFRDYTRRRQSEFLEDLLKKIAESRPAEGRPNDWFSYHARQERHLVRLETLLWGGDDILLVVPAWKGWDVIRLFFAQVTGAIGGEPWRYGGSDEPAFTYTAGLVFCNKKASIHQMRDLAEDLFIEGKKEASHGGHDNWLGYEVMESFDVAGDDLERWRGSRLSSDAQDGRLLLLKPAQLEPAADFIRKVRAQVDDPDSGISRRKIERYARTMRLHPKADSKFDDEVEKYLSSMEFRALEGLDTRQKLHHLAALWDYVT